MAVVTGGPSQVAAVRTPPPGTQLDPVLVMQASTCALSYGGADAARFIEFIGDLDSFTADCIDPALFEIADEHADVVIDLSGLAFCDSAGFRQLERFCDRITASGAHVWLHECSAAVLRLTHGSGSPGWTGAKVVPLATVRCSTTAP